MPVKTVIQLRRDTAANWTSVNPILSVGEQGYETDTNKTKIGDGSTVWTSLTYHNPGGAVSQSQVTDLTTTLAGKQAVVSGVSDTEIGYLDGVTSAIQTQIDGKSSTSHTHSISGVTGLQTALDEKAPLASPTFTGTTTTATLTVTGDLTVGGTTTTVNATDLSVTDPLIYIGEGNDANVVDLGLVGSFNDGTYQHAGLARDATDGKWKLFKGVIDEPTTTINFSQGTLDTLALGSIEATTATIGDVSNTELQYLNGVTSAIQGQIDGKAATSHTHAISDVTDLTTTISGLNSSIDAKIPLSIADAKGDLIVATAADTVAKLGVGSDTQILTVDSTTATGLKWAAPAASGMSNPMTTAGDLIIGGTSGTPDRLAAGTAGYILQTNGSGSAPTWVAVSAGEAISSFLLMGA